MLLECTVCEIPFFNYWDLEAHIKDSHPKVYRLDNRLDVRIIKRVLNLHVRTHRCPGCYMPFPHPDLRDFHVEYNECDTDELDDFDRYRAWKKTRPRRASVEGILEMLGGPRRGVPLEDFHLTASSAASSRSSSSSSSSEDGVERNTRASLPSLFAKLRGPRARSSVSDEDATGATSDGAPAPRSPSPRLSALFDTIRTRSRRRSDPLAFSC